MGARTERNARQRETRNLYNELKYKTVAFRLKQDGSDGVTPEAIKAAAERSGQSVNQFIIEAIKARLEE